MQALLKKATKYSDLVAAVAVVVVVIMLIIPLPKQVVDLMVAANIVTGLALLLATMYVPRALDLAAFPSLLLLTTMFRLAINVSITRLILLEGDAGEMVKAFGEFVVGGNIVVGLVIFLILVIIQFVVITNGAGRVSEVAARFTLDAMPGKQMAIDADLNSGQITEEEARHRRQEISREADFYGSMDGASKFVKGDAIAGLIIVVINLIGGMAVGVAQQGMSFSEAIETFSILTIGDGLAAQIPALLISIATGILVTRAASDGDLGSDITTQLTSQPRVLMLAGGVSIFFSIIPGMPKIPFIIMGATLLLGGYYLNRSRGQEVVEEEIAPALSAADEEAQRAAQAVTVDPLELAIGAGLISLVDQRAGGNLLSRISAVRQQIAAELGMVIAPVRIHDDPQLESHEYVFKVRGAEVARSHVVPSHLLAINSGEALGALTGIATTEPAFGLPAVWIDENLRLEAEGLSYTVVDAESVIITHLTETIRRHVASLLSRQETKKLLDALKQANEAAVNEVVPDLLQVGEVQRVLQALLAEGVPIRDLSSILEAIGDRARQNVRDPLVLAEYARRALARTIISPFLDDARTLKVIGFLPATEHEIANALTETPDGELLGLDPNQAQQLVQSISDASRTATQMGIRPVVLCSGRIRRHVRAMISQAEPSLAVIAYQEIPDGTPVEPLTQL